MLKKIKDSIFKFKKYLEGEAQEVENLYSRYKKLMFHSRSKPVQVWNFIF